MKKIIYSLLFAFTLANYSLNAQSCSKNLLSDPTFSSGLSGTWTQFSSPAVALKSKTSGCIDTFVMLGGGTSIQGGVQQEVNFVSSKCYDICLCMESSQYARVRIFAATDDTTLTGRNLRYNTYNTASAQLIDSIDVHSNGASYCKKGWTASKNFTRLIILNTPHPNNLGAELHIDNVCLTACATSVDDEHAPADVALISSGERLFVSCQNGSFDASIMDITGKTVRRFKGVEQVNMDKNELIPGIYILNIRKGNSVYSYKIVF